MNIGSMIENELGEVMAKYLRPVNHADVVVNCPPVWVRASGAEYFFGVKRNFLNNLVIERKVVAKKADKIVLYRYADIEKAINEMNELKKEN